MRHRLAKLFVLLTILLAVIVASVVLGWGVCDSEVQADPAHEPPVLEVAEEVEPSIEEVMRERREKLLQDEADRREAMLAKVKARLEENPVPAKIKRRKVRRFDWEADAEARGKAWNIPEEESEQATLTAFLRICIAEADGSPQDCVGIFQVMKNIRRRGCERAAVRRITECDEAGETMLSVMRRAQPHIMAAKGYTLRNKRAGWIRNLETDCEVPEGWDHGEARWDAQYGSRRCPYAVELGRALIAGTDLAKVSRPGHRLEWLPGRPITWGGRCESGKAACDDRVACARGLARITGTGTHNAFWRRPATEEEIDPVCKALGYGRVAGVVEELETDVADGEPETK